jgi:hypothetical protein
VGFRAELLQIACPISHKASDARVRNAKILSSPDRSGWLHEASANQVSTITAM